MSNRINPSHNITKEKTLVGTVDVARQALVELTHESSIGEHAGVVYEAERVITHAFVCQLPGYRGWFWTVTLSRVPRGRTPKVDEVTLLPGPDALLAPDWVPWADRLRPDDVSGTDRLPYNPDDANLQPNDDPEELMPGFSETGADADQLAGYDMGLGRARVLSDQGRSAAFQRWYEGPGGPKNRSTRAAKATCSACGYLMHMGGSARQLFGVCANEWSEFDGRVVSLDHGCGAHSETDVRAPEKIWDQSEPVVNDISMDVVES
ncbi:DUF3027 domain-containing protein [Trueperella bialowiezensis]|uniref:Protein of uncharacterized function (DUF3027) n=1 Tax=Trueperella bialowiezensis TaxID=312285 RepID=A0A3S4VT25_9ACTO|nr:DUF3027 domain-containing protein [Trueperella bialowiezensis]VEI13092.1 Protein of uncharacterised function (DUF3027) [Trueperella bialowiezensis]